ncbi:aminoalkylphosphonic acid N-acetyltransferase [Paracoccus haematequi]|uniref:Aminoalkylphosphonic acid N-acetyltransferase n=1 Tax=Paracoccus haematequi TaxID=2491866 RepID=A0A3S4GRE7_9RHOB|nr:GNAT family N-acetyltransferase [Paracoccus haematequi]VDS09097.1 aminoalkylphosphonic acid N-acetyltransferase [Paracoccus haematequi]
MTVRFRPAHRDDIPAVAALLADDILGRTREGADMAPYLAAFDAMQAQGGNMLVVGLSDDRIVACYQIVFIPGLSATASLRAQIEGVRVASDLRGRGIGARLIADAEDRARAAGCGLMQLTTNRTRVDAHRFYDRTGFTPSHIGYKKPL